MLIKYMNRHLKLAAFFSVIISLVSVPVNVTVAKVLAQIVTEANAGNSEKVIRFSLFVIGLVGGLCVFRIVFGRILENYNACLKQTCRMEMYKEYLNNPLDIMFEGKNGDMLERITNDFETVINKRLVLIPQLGVSIVTFIVYFGVLTAASKWMVIVLFVMSLIQLIPPVIVKRKLQVNYEECRNIEALLTDKIVESYKGFKIIKIYGLKHWFMDFIEDIHNKYEKIGTDSIFAYTVETSMETFVDYVLKYGIYAVIGLLFWGRMISLQAGIEAIVLSESFFVAVKAIFTLIPQFGISKIAENHLTELCYEGSKKDQIMKNGDLLCHAASIDLSGHSLKNVEFEIKKDGIYLLKGANGSGKSTLFLMLLGLRKCDMGDVRVGTVNPDKLSEENFPEKIFYLPQEDMKIPVTPAKLYSMVWEDMPDKMEEVVQYSMDMNISRETLCNVPISNLSGGERKKVYLCMARGMDAKILFLDEPTNSLDKESVKIVYDWLKKFSGKILIVAHDNCFDDIAKRIFIIDEEGGFHA